MSWSRQVMIHAPPQSVWAAMTDLQRVNQWIPDIVKAEVVGGGVLGPGASWIETRGVGKKEFTLEISIRDWAPAERMVAGSVYLGTDSWYSYDLAVVDGGTRVSLVADGKAKWWARPMFGMLMRMTEKADGDQLQRLKRYVESAAEGLTKA